MTRRLKIEPPALHTDTAPPTLRRIDRALRTIGTGSPRYDAAILLLCGDAWAQNTYRLARFTGIDATFVARCARHLVDNGVWSCGVTMSLWHHPEHGADAFWADVEVALGQARRRIEPTGVICWEPAGNLGLPTGGAPRLIEFVPPIRQRSRRADRPTQPNSGSTPAAATSAPPPVGLWLGMRPTRAIGDRDVEAPQGRPRDECESILTTDTGTPRLDPIALSAFPEATWL